MCPVPKTRGAGGALDSPTSSTASMSNNDKTASVCPSDWPGPGPIDLKIHDLPHFSSAKEWWYVNAHLDVAAPVTSKSKGSKKGGTQNDKETKKVSLFASFFRTALEYDEAKKEYVFAHTLLWAVMDHEKEKYYNVNLFDPQRPQAIAQKLKEQEHNINTASDKRLTQAMMEVLEKGKVPYPDRLLQKNPIIIGKDLSRLPDKDSKEYQMWMDKVGQYQQEQVLAHKDNSKKATQKKTRRGMCCLPRKEILSSVVADLPPLTLTYDENTLVKNKDGSYQLHLEDNEVHNIKATLKFTAKTEPIRNGNDGIIDGEGVIEDFFYYCLPNCEVTGTITLPDDEKTDLNDAKIHQKNYFIIDDEYNKEEMLEPVKTHTHKVTGSGWYDHQFGCKKPSGGSDGGHDEAGKVDTDTDNFSYTWLSLQLDNGYQMSCSEYFFHESTEAGSQSKDKPKYFGILITPTGQCQQLLPSDIQLVAKGDQWVSMRTFREYPLKWTLVLPKKNIQLELEAVFGQQEFPTVNGVFWEGCVKVAGVFDGKTIAGNGIVERHGFYPAESYSMQHFFKCVSRETLKSVKKILPFNPEGEKLNEIVCHKDNQGYTQHIESQQFSKALVEPIRAVMDRGGKSWRSYAALACCDIVGGNSQPVKDWLALPELMHVGSLIVDDVEDRSIVRRGGPCSHLMYGEDVAINAGTMAYFLGQIVIYQGDGDDKQKVEIYNMYFEGMRAAHSGQAMDIHGLDYMMPEVVEHGGDLCRQRVITIHRLKSAAPVSFFARLGGKLGGGSKAQSEALGAFFEALGIAFQIVDDVLNLRGFTDGLKTRGEDITAGKVTYPIAVAMNRLKKEDRAKLWEIVSSKPEDIETIGKAVALVDKVNAIDDSFKEAKDIIEVGWKKLDPLVVDSMVKVNLRAFSLYVLDRTY